MKNQLLKKLVALSFVVMSGVVATGAANASAIPGYERPRLRAEMDVTMTGYFPSEVQDVIVTLNRRDDSRQPTSLNIEYTIKGEEDYPVNERLSIVKIEDIGCGSKRIFASLNSETDPSRVTGARANLVLEDHSKRLCDDYRPAVWTASYRSGYGWCGTMDLVLELSGNPKPVFTPMHDLH